eukprot:1850648-Amphidinium_carterae.2
MDMGRTFGIGRAAWEKVCCPGWQAVGQCRASVGVMARAYISYEPRPLFVWMSALLPRFGVCVVVSQCDECLRFQESAILCGCPGCFTHPLSVVLALDLNLFRSGRTNQLCKKEAYSGQLLSSHCTYFYEVLCGGGKARSKHTVPT